MKTVESMSMAIKCQDQMPTLNSSSYAVPEMRPPMAWCLMVVLLVHFAAHAGVVKLSAHKLGDLKE